MKFQICKLNGKYAIRQKYFLGTGDFIGRYTDDKVTDWFSRDLVIKYCLYDTEEEVIEVGKKWRVQTRLPFKIEVIRVIDL